MINAVQPRAVQPVGRCGIPANCTHPGRVLLARSSTIVPFAREEPPRYIRSVGRGVSKSRGVAAIELSTAMSLYSSPGLRSQPGWLAAKLRRPAGRRKLAVRAGQTAGATCCIWARCRAPATSDNARLQRAACVHTATVVIVALSLLLRRWSRAPLLHAA